MCKKCISERATMTVRAGGLREVFPWLSVKAAGRVLDHLPENKLVAKMEIATFRVLELADSSEVEGIQEFTTLAIEELYSKTDSDKVKLFHSFMAYVLNEVTGVISITPVNTDTLYNLLFNASDVDVEAAGKNAAYGDEVLQMLKSATWSMLGSSAGPAEFMKADKSLFITLVKRGLFDNYVKESHYYRNDYRTLLMESKIVHEEDAAFDPSIGGFVAYVQFEEPQEREWEIDPTAIIPVDDPDFNQHRRYIAV